jgi:hypothetical protein
VGNKEVSLGGSSLDTVPYLPMLFKDSRLRENQAGIPLTVLMGLLLNGMYLVLQPLYIRTEELKLEEGL